MLHIVIAGNGNSVNGVAFEFKVMMTGDADHLTHTFDIKYEHSVNTRQNENVKNNLEE